MPSYHLQKPDAKDDKMLCKQACQMQHCHYIAEATSHKGHADSEHTAIVDAEMTVLNSAVCSLTACTPTHMPQNRCLCECL